MHAWQADTQQLKPVEKTAESRQLRHKRMVYAHIFWYRILACSSGAIPFLAIAKSTAKGYNSANLHRMGAIQKKLVMAKFPGN